MKLFSAVLFIIMLFASCATVEETTQKDTPDETGEISDDKRPAWYNYTNRSYADSASFTGVGMAASGNEAEANDQAYKQAVANTKLAIDRFAENVRMESTEHQGGEQFASSQFIIDLRNTVQALSLQNELQITEEHIKTEDSVHRVYIMAAIPRDMAIRRLGERLQNSEFLQRLRQQ